MITAIQPELVYKKYCEKSKFFSRVLILRVKLLVGEINSN